jgi:DNA polymerase-3 subunit gamma/tau
MGKALYRNYRPKTLEEVVGQKHVVAALKNAIEKSQLSHAYLFTGPRGVGKTSIARILAHEINELPYNEDELPLDIIEIDAASNRRIDEIRDLRERIQIAPVNAKYKVYIIDEVHMLTREAFNALLKTLEEPPKHVIFILATTEAHKLPETIVSRTQKYSFKLASTPEVVEHLKRIAKQENITIDDESLVLIADKSGGSLRDALSILDQVRHISDKITVEITRDTLGVPSDELAEGIVGALGSKDTKALISTLSAAYESGLSPSAIANQLIDFIRGKYQDPSLGLSLASVVELNKDLLKVESSTNPEVQLEIALIAQTIDTHQAPVKIIHSQAAVNPPLTISTAAPKKSKPQKATDTKAPPETLKKPGLAEPATLPADAPIAQSASTEGSLAVNDEAWATMLEEIKKKYNTLHGVLRMARPVFGPDGSSEIVLEFEFPFHQKRMSEAKNTAILNETFSSLGYKTYSFDCIVKKQGSKPARQEVELEPYIFDSKSQTTDNGVMDQIRSVFGGAEVLE